MDTARDVSIRWRIQTLVTDSDVFLLEPPEQYVNWGFRGAWEEGQKLQGLWNEDEVAESRKYQDPEECYAKWKQDQEDEAAHDHEYMDAYRYFKGGY